MNPGGDFGKKELSPALRNRFTEIWCEPCTDRQDKIEIIQSNIKFEQSVKDISFNMGEIIMNFIDWFSKTDIGGR